MPFDGLFTLYQRLHEIGQRLPDALCLSAWLAGEASPSLDRARVGDPGSRIAASHAAVARDSAREELHRRETEVLQRMDENLRRLRELVESRAVAATLFVEPL